MLHQLAAIVNVNVASVSNCLWECYIIFLQVGVIVYVNDTSVSNCLWERYINLQQLFMLMFHQLVIVCENVTSYFYK
jgi:hypothetical protein